MYLYLSILLLLTIIFLLFYGINRKLKSTKKNEIDIDDSISSDLISSREYASYIAESAKNNLQSDTENSVHTVNTYLHSIEIQEIVYEVFSLYYSSLQEMNDDENNTSEGMVTEFKKGTNEERVLKAEKYFKITCENIVFRKGIFGNEHPKWFKILLVSVQKERDIEKREVLKTVNSLNINYSY